MQKKANIFSGVRQQANQQTGLQQSPGPIPTAVRSSFDYLSNLERSPKAGGQNEPSKDLVPPSRAPTIMKSSFTKNSNVNSSNKNWLSNSSAHFQIAQSNNDDLLGSPTGHTRQASQSLHGQFQLPSNNQRGSKQQYNQPSPILWQDPQSQQINKFQSKQAYLPSTTLSLNPPTVQAHQSYSQIPHRSCARHRQESVKRVCSVYECKFPILLCGDCMYEDPDHTKAHQQQIILLLQFFELIDKEESKGRWKTAREEQLRELKGEGMRVLSNAEGITKEITAELEMQKTKIKEEAAFLISQFTQKIKDQESYHLQQLVSRQQQCEDIAIKFREELNIAIRETEQQNHIPIRTYLQQHFAKNPDPNEVEAIFKSARDSLFARNPTDQSIVTQLHNLDTIKTKWQMMMQDLTAMQSSSGFVNIDKEEAQKQILEMVQTIYRKNQQFNPMSNINFNITLPNQQQSQQQQQQQYASFGSIPYAQPPQYTSQPQQLQSQHSFQPSFNASNKEYLIENVLQGSASKDTVMTMTTEYDYNRNSNNPNVEVMSKKRSNTESEKKQIPASYFQLSLKNDKDKEQSRDRDDKGQKNDGNNIKQLNSTNISLPMRPSSSQSQSDAKKATKATATVIKSNNSIPAASLEKKGIPTKPALLQESAQAQKKQSQNQSIQQSFPEQSSSLLSANNMNNQSLQHYPQSNQVSQLHIIPELNVSSSVGSLFTQQLHSGTADSFQACEVMEGSKVASIIQSGNSISLSQIPKEIPLQNQPTPTCFCIIGDMVVACGDNLGVIKIYDLQTAQCIGARRINTDRNGQARSILSMTYVFYEKQQQPLICCVTEDSNNNGNTVIDICNVLDESKSFRLEPALAESTSYENNSKNKQGSTLSISKINNSRSLSSRNGSASKITIDKGSQHNISLPSSFSSLVNMEDGRNILEQSNKRTINFWDISSRKSIASIQTEYDITSVLAMGREIASVLLALSTSEVVIYKVEYDSQVDSDEIVSGRIINIKVLRKVAVGLQEASSSQGSVMLKLFNQKVLISVNKTVHVWNAASLTQEDQVQPYQYSNSSGSIIDLLAIASNEELYILCACQSDGFILLQPANAAAQGMKHHLKDFAFPANAKKNRLLMSKNAQNQLFLVALNASKASITFWRLNGETK